MSNILSYLADIVTIIGISTLFISVIGYLKEKRNKENFVKYIVKNTVIDTVRKSSKKWYIKTQTEE